MKLLKGIYVIVKMGTVLLLLGLAFMSFPLFVKHLNSTLAVTILSFAIFWLIVFQAHNIKELKTV